MVSILCLASCKWHHDYCHRCGEHLDCCKCYNNCYYSCSTRNDAFTAGTLIGIWQTNYHVGYENGIGFTPKQFNFVNHQYCDITYSIGNSSTWYTETFNYVYSSGHIKFSGHGRIFSLKINGFLYPTLTLSDSHGKYEWYKRL